MRTNISRRDTMWNDDWVGFSLDSVGNGQSAYDHFVNPSGIQGDVLTTPSAGENSAPRPLTLELAPTVTYSRQQARATPAAFAAADSDPDAGLSIKYGLTSEITAEGTINPDFSQVESDAFQVEVNQRFPLFFSEKRPFFMEGIGNFELAGVGGDAIMRTAVHTRRIVDPVWGLKTTGSAGRVTFGVLAAGDQAPGRQLAGNPNPFLGDRRDFYVARGQYSLGRGSYVGAIVTDSEFAGGHNRVAGADVSRRWGRQSASATFLTTQFGPICWPRGSFCRARWPTAAPGR